MGDKAKNIVRWFLVLAGILLVGVFSMNFILGYSMIDSVFYTMTTLTTVGYGEPPGLSQGGKVFMSGLMLVGVGAMGMTLAKLAEYFWVGSVLDILGRRRGYRVEKLSKHWIICGIGQVGIK